jgi:hypothetical protein
MFIIIKNDMCIVFKRFTFFKIRDNVEKYFVIERTISVVTYHKGLSRIKTDTNIK